MDWWIKRPEDLTDEERLAKKLAYGNVLYLTSDGKHVLHDIMRHTHEIVPNRSPEASLTLIQHYHYIRACVGLDEETVIDAEAKTIKM